MEKIISSNNSVRRFLGFTTTITIGISISIIVFFLIINNNTDSLKDKFFYESQLQTENLKNKLFGYQRSMELFKSFIESSEYVSEDEFNSFSKPLFDKGDFSHMLWLENKPNDYLISRHSSKKGYKELDKNIDLRSHPEFISYINDVLKTEKPVISKNINFSPGEPSDIVFIYPVLKSGNIIGFIMGVLDLKKIFNESFVIDTPDNYKNLFVYNKLNLLFNFNGVASYFNDSVNSGISNNSIIKQAVFVYKENIDLLSDQWTIVFVPTSQYISLSANIYPWIILVLGICTTATLSMFIFNIIGRNIATQEAIRKSTRELEYRKQHTEAILNTVLEGIITINVNGIIQTFNPAAENIFGYKKEEVIGKNVKMLMSGKNKKNHDQYIKNYLDTGDAKIIGIGREVEAERKNGEKFPMALGITQTILDGEKIFVGIIRDVTKEKEDKVKLEEYNKKLEEAWADASKANKAKSEFLATMSHEIRTPMNGIIGMAELLGYSELSSQQKKYLKTIKSSGDLLLVLINDILDFSKIEAGELELESIPVVINALISEATQLLSSRAKENSVEIAVRNTQDTPMAIWGDPVRLRQIMINLIGNAIKFSKGGYVLVNVETVQKNNDNVLLRFEIKDTGVGIPEDKLDNIFEKFSQADSSTTRKFGGTGLGLAICKKLVSLMGGKIGVESQVGKGSLFWFEIEAKVQTYLTHTNIDAKRNLNDIKILIVDDYPINLEIFSEYLNKIGVKCDVADSAELALEILEIGFKNSSPYDIALIDYDMPYMNGEMVGKAISENPNKFGKPKLILVTALDKSIQTDFLQEAGYSGKLLKPVYSSVLIDTLLNETQSIQKIKKDTNDKKPNKKEKEKISALPNYKIKVLVVEDFEPNQEVIKSILEELGCEVDLSKDGIEAISILKNNYMKYDLVFMDCQMPNMDGFETTKEIRKNEWGKNLKIVALTANALQGDKEKCRKAGMDDYLSKPVKIISIKNMIAKILKDKAA